MGYSFLVSSMQDMLDTGYTAICVSECHKIHQNSNSQGKLPDRNPFRYTKFRLLTYSFLLSNMMDSLQTLTLWALTQQDISYIGFCHTSLSKVCQEDQDDNSLDRGGQMGNSICHTPFGPEDHRFLLSNMKDNYIYYI